MKPLPANLSNHYGEVGNRYDRLYQKVFGKNRKEVVRFISERVVGDGDSPLVIADIGGGTGETIETLKSTLSCKHHYILVEPFEKMAEVSLRRKGRPDEYVQAVAEEFVKDTRRTGGVDVIICQEMIHHVYKLQEFFKGCFSLLRPFGRIIIITRPVEVEFPFGMHARRQWRESYAVHPEAMPALLEKAGFIAEVETKAFPVAIDKDSWLECVGPSPLFSGISLLTPEERREDIAELASLPLHLSFHDHMIFIFGKKV